MRLDVGQQVLQPGSFQHRTRDTVVVVVVVHQHPLAAVSGDRRIPVALPPPPSCSAGHRPPCQGKSDAELVRSIKNWIGALPTGKSVLNWPGSRTFPRPRGASGTVSVNAFSGQKNTIGKLAHSMSALHPNRAYAERGAMPRRGQEWHACNLRSRRAVAGLKPNHKSPRLNTNWQTIRPLTVSQPAIMAFRLFTRRIKRGCMHLPFSFTVEFAWLQRAPEMNSRTNERAERLHKEELNSVIAAIDCVVKQWRAG